MPPPPAQAPGFELAIGGGGAPWSTGCSFWQETAPQRTDKRSTAGGNRLLGVIGPPGSSRLLGTLSATLKHFSGPPTQSKNTSSYLATVAELCNPYRPAPAGLGKSAIKPTCFGHSFRHNPCSRECGPVDFS